MTNIIIVVNEDKVLVKSEQGIICHAMNFTAMLNPIIEYNNLVMEAHKRGITINYDNMFEKNIISLWPDYEKAVKQANECFSKLQSLAKLIARRNISSRRNKAVKELIRLSNQYKNYFSIWPVNRQNEAIILLNSIANRIGYMYRNIDHYAQISL